jgi:hypothetical protein
MSQSSIKQSRIDEINNQREQINNLFPPHVRPLAAQAKMQLMWRPEEVLKPVLEQYVADGTPGHELLDKRLLAGDKLKIENNPLGKLLLGSLKGGIDTSRLSEGELKEWERIVEIANAKDNNDKYLNPTLREVYDKLNTGNRTFVIDNTTFGRNSPTVGKFTITKFKGENDFSEAVIELDFNKIKGIDRTTDADRVAGFKKFEGLLGGGKKADLRLAEVFGHEGSHAQVAINNPAEGVRLQKLLNERDAMLAGPTYRDKKGRLLNPMPQALVDKMKEADQALIPTETFAQQKEKTINEELQAYSRRGKDR